MSDLIAFANFHQGALTALATIVIALAAIATGIFTWNLVWENRLLRKAGTEPEVVAYLMADPRYKTIINFVLANIGQGPAKNVQFRIEADENDLSTHNVQLSNRADRKALSVLPQAERIIAFFGVGHELFKEPRLRPFKIHIQYEDLKGKSRSGDFELDVSQFDGLITLGLPPEHEMAEAIKKIEQHLHSFASGMKRLKVETITTEQAREEATKWRQETLALLERERKKEQATSDDQSGSAS